MMHHWIIIQSKTSQIIYRAFYAMAYPNDWAFDLKSVHLVNLNEAEHMSIGHLVKSFLPFVLQMV